MRYLALATDYDGTLAEEGTVSPQAWEAVERLRKSGRKLVLVSGRELNDLKTVCPQLDRFDRVVAENGGVLYRPATGEVTLLAPPPSEEFVRAVRARGVKHLGVGRTIVDTVEPYQKAVLEAIHDLGLELHVIFNKGAVMVLPSGVNKATGLRAALKELGLSPHNVVGVGDAENDHAFLQLCECSVAVANALEMVKKHADVTTRGAAGHGVIELIDELLADDLRGRADRLARHDILLGRQGDGREVRLPPYGTVALIAGPSGSGKSTVTTGLLERLSGAGYQFCVIDPEGDYEGFDGAVVLGDPRREPSVEEMLQLLRSPRANAVVNLLGIPLADRPLFCASLLLRLQQTRAETGRPHWLVFDEAHHLFPANWAPAAASLPEDLETALLITVHPGQVSPAVLRHVNAVLAVGDAPDDTLRGFAAALGETVPGGRPPALKNGQVLTWLRDAGGASPFVVEVEPGHTERRRHTRKYAEGVLIPERSFYFRGPEGKLNLRAHNLVLFLEMAQGVDDETWLHHLRRGDYSRWFREIIGDKGLADEAEGVERDQKLSADESRERIRAAVAKRFTLPENPSVPRIEPTAGV